MHRSAGLWYIDLIRRAPVSAGWVGVGGIAFSWGVTALLGFDFTDARFEARVPYVLCVAIGYLLAVSPLCLVNIPDVAHAALRSSRE